MLDIDISTATFEGDLTSDGGSSITERGFVYSSTNETPIIDESETTKITSELGDGTGIYTSDITDLVVAKKYYVRSYAVNEKYTSYGDVKDFTTATLNSSFEVKLGSLTVSDRNEGSTIDGTALNYTNAIGHPDRSNTGFKGEYYTWAQAQTACPGDWRLPTKTELDTIDGAMQFSDGRVYLADGNGNRCYFPLSGAENTPSNQNGYYWSSTVYEEFDSRAWNLFVFPSQRYVIVNNKTAELSVRCVKTAQ